MNKLLIKTITIFFLLLLLLNEVNSQTPLKFSMVQAQEYAYQNNYDLKNSVTDVVIAGKVVKQNTSIGLPQINGSIDFLDNLAIATQIVPNFLSFLDTTGHAPKTLEFQFGLKYNLTTKAQLTQLIYSGQYLVGLQTAKAYLETVKQQNLKDKMDVRDMVANNYLIILMLKEQTKIMDSIYRVTNQQVEELRAVLKQGLIEDIDVEQLELNKSDLEAILINTNTSLDLNIARLKYTMGLKENQKIILTDTLDFFINSLAKDYLMNQPFDYSQNIDYTLLKKREFQTLMQYKLAKTAYQPTLSGFLGLSMYAQRSDFNFFSSNDPWYKTANWGISLSIPIWSSGNRKYSVDQAYLNYEKMKVNDEKLKTGLDLQVATAKNDFNNGYLVYLNKKKGLDFSTKIYVKTIKKYKEGVSGSTDLNQKYNQFLQSQRDYLQAMYNVLNLKIQLARLLEKV